MCKTNLSEDEVKELDLVKSQLETMDLNIRGNLVSEETRSEVEQNGSNQTNSHRAFSSKRRKEERLRKHVMLYAREMGEE